MMKYWNHLQDLFMNSWPMMSWLDVARLNWLILFPALALLLYLAFYRLRLRLSIAQSSICMGAPRWTLRRIVSWLKGIFISLALISLIVSSAGPRIGWTWIESRQSGMDIAVAVDVSRSMMAQDLDPSRLEQAKRMIIDLLQMHDILLNLQAWWQSFLALLLRSGAGWPEDAWKVPPQRAGR